MKTPLKKQIGENWQNVGFTEYKGCVRSRHEDQANPRHVVQAHAGQRRGQYKTGRKNIGSTSISRNVACMKVFFELVKWSRFESTWEELVGLREIFCHR